MPQEGCEQRATVRVQLVGLQTLRPGKLWRQPAQELVLIGGCTKGIEQAGLSHSFGRFHWEGHSNRQICGDCDLPQGFRTTNYVRDWLPIQREQCTKRVSPKSRWLRSSARRIASRCPC